MFYLHIYFLLPWDIKTHEGRVLAFSFFGFVLFCFFLFYTLRNPQCLEQCPVHKGYSVNILLGDLRERMSVSFPEFAGVSINVKLNIVAWAP